MSALRLLLWATVMAALPACRGGDLRAPSPAIESAPARPARRTSGPRLPAPSALRATNPLAGAALLAANVALATDAGAAAAQPLLEVAQQHVERLFQTYGETLDLRLPDAGVSVVLYARREEFERALAERVGEHTGWGAFYDVGYGTVAVCLEPFAGAPLPVTSDLKHELTHAVLDLSSPRPVPHARLQQGLHFWLWEGIAVHAEGLGEPDGGAAYPLREARFRERMRRGEVTPLSEFLQLDPPRFEGRHYDMLAPWMRFLLSDALLGPRTLDLLRRLLRGDVLHYDPEREWGLPLAHLEARWRAWLGLAPTVLSTGG